MNKKIKIILLIIAIIIFIAIVGIIILKNNSEDKSNKEEWKNDFSEVDKNEINYKNNTTINELKEEMKMEADSSLYEITQEYDGRNTLNIKRDILYKVAFAGIIKQDKPILDEIDKIFGEDYPKKDGIWVSKQSRDAFLKMINEESSVKYYINDEGYLAIQEDNGSNNENDSKIKNIINSNKKIIVDINSYDYEVDVVTGEIVKYPFEQLGDSIDIVPDSNDKIIVLAQNQNKKFTNKEIIQNFLDNI